MSEVIGFIGLGAMGLPMASNLIRKGFSVIAYDIDQEKIKKLAALGAKPGGSIADTASAASIVVTILPATEHVEKAVLGQQGVLQNLKPGSLLLEMSTIDPHVTDNVQIACQEKGIGFVDAPVGRLASHAERGESLFMVGGSVEHVERVQPLLNAMGTTIHHCGPAGAGIRMKVVNNFMLLVTAQVTAEAILLGSKFGLSVETMKKVTADTTATNGQFQVAFATKCLKGDLNPGFTIDLAHKDISLAMEAARELRVGLPVGAAAREMMGIARGSEYARCDYSAMLDFICGAAGVEPPRLPG
ncbi:NAD(P)-dependent oxidoreductase [Noviherbaspirillum sedimenti]|uniref:NAD(P)-dependent oxidoreductase n=1 Tax=Noviherbaspirillum sedimenti TaxID=2320865 RepID=A0A3A3G1S9_9BURK|nr:NAD(P)-binding domain-containing protein [Noviherbaspirillum sedimenti]RJG02417.1 NAD(P)-dependent oxidoreductase [Noviherbaspirillum sedimenti]